MKTAFSCFEVEKTFDPESEKSRRSRTALDFGEEKKIPYDFCLYDVAKGDVFFHIFSKIQLIFLKNGSIIQLKLQILADTVKIWG